MSSSPTAYITLTQQTERRTATAMRALLGSARLHYRAHRLYDGARPAPVYAAHVAGYLPVDDEVAARGVADAVALRLRLSDRAALRRQAPAGPVARVAFELLEQLRVESLCPATLPGSRRNLDHLFARWLDASAAQGVTETELGLRLVTVALVVRSRLGDHPLTEAQQDLTEGTRMALSPRLGSALRILREHRHDQELFGDAARVLAEAVAAGVEGRDGDGVDERELRELGFVPLVGDLDEDPAREDQGGGGSGSAALGDRSAYRVHDTSRDHTSTAADLGRPEQLDRWAQELRDQPWPVSPTRLARGLHDALSASHHDGWTGGHEEGVLDAGALTRLITERGVLDIHRQPSRTQQPDAVVGILLDCSGSMRRHHPALAALCDLLGRSLDLLDVPTEILGFSTVDWPGARGAGIRPGRLGGVHHLVLKPMHAPWSQARRGLAPLLRADLFREGVDGEALEWAAGRLALVEARRRMLLVISDGGPMQSATRAANGEGYLDDHLIDVAARLARAGAVDVRGLGVEADLSAYYATSATTSLDAGLTTSVLRDLTGLIGVPVGR